MTGNELAAIRRRLGLSPYAFGRAIGHTGNRNTVHVYIRRCERMAQVPPTIAGAVEQSGLKQRAGLAPLKART